MKVASDKEATFSICILFLQRRFNPKKEGVFSIVRQALFRVKSRRKAAEGAFSKPWSQPWGGSTEVIFLGDVCTLLSIWRSSKPKGLKVSPPLPAQKKGICVVEMTRVANWTHAPFVLAQNTLKFQGCLFELDWVSRTINVFAGWKTRGTKPTRTCVYLCQLIEGLHVIPKKRWLKKYGREKKQVLTGLGHFCPVSLQNVWDWSI